jgi:hypothetical protein
LTEIGCSDIFILDNPAALYLHTQSLRRNVLYLAQQRVKRKTHYFIRETFKDGDGFKSRDLFHLDIDPARYIIYPGGNAFYIDSVVEETLSSLGVEPSADDMDDIFWPFLKPEIRRALGSFREKAKARRARVAINPEEEERIRRHVSEFDKRRIHYLRCGQIDQGRIGRMPVRLFKWLLGKSRDEIEQHFVSVEQCLKPHEIKTYTYVIFDLQRFFSESCAKKMPQGLDQNKVDKHFLEEICRLNSDASFWAGENVGSTLHEYLIRYVVMFFDNEYGRDAFLHDYVRDFMNARRFRRAPARKQTVTFDEASTLFGVKKETLRAMTKRGLTRLYRRMAKKLHPDKGGEHEKFIQLTEAYQELLKRKG